MPARDQHHGTILVVEDNPVNLSLAVQLLQAQGQSVLTAESGDEAMEVLGREPVDLVLLDIVMPGMDGFEVLRQMESSRTLRHLPVVVVSSLEATDSAVRCIEMGAMDYLTKPFNPVLLNARVQACLDKKALHDRELRYQEELERRVRAQVREITMAQLSAIFSMSKLAESKDPETGAHLERMREYCRLIAAYMVKAGLSLEGLDEQFVDTIYAASPLHDIGKVGIPDRVLLKPGKLTDDEWDLMRSHTIIGGSTLRATEERHPGSAFVRMGIEISEGHHEKWDGSGYPRGLVGEQIPLSARILALGDVYDALTSKRVYKEAFSHDKSREIILGGRGAHFDPQVVDTFLALEREFIDVRSRFTDDD